MEAEVPPSFSLNGQFLQPIKQLINQTMPSEALKMAVDLRNLFPETNKVRR
jgi:hypothetical protein